MLPLSLLRAAQKQPMLVELKSGDTYNGTLVSCDAFMNLCLKDVICTDKGGDKFWQLAEAFIRGGNIKYIRVPDEVSESVVDEPVPAGPSAGAGVRGRGRGAPGNTRTRGARGGRGRA